MKTVFGAIFCLSILAYSNVEARVQSYLLDKKIKLDKSLEAELESKGKRLEAVVDLYREPRGGKSFIRLTINENVSKCPRNVVCVWSGVRELYQLELPIVGLTKKDACGAKTTVAKSVVTVGGPVETMTFTDNTENFCDYLGIQRYELELKRTVPRPGVRTQISTFAGGEFQN